MATKGTKGGKKKPTKSNIGYGGGKKKPASKKKATKPDMGYGATKKSKTPPMGGGKMGGKPRPPKPRKP